MKSNEDIVQNRKIFRCLSINGEILLDGGLNGSVGLDGMNYYKDVEKIQKRLIQLGLLDQDHSDKARSFRKQFISSFEISETIEAIEDFQEKFHVRFWIETDERSKMVGTNSFHRALIAPFDISFKILKEYTQYMITYPIALSNQTKTIKLTNFHKSIFTVDYEGISFLGTLKANLTKQQFSHVQIPDYLKGGLLRVMETENNYDFLTTYDKNSFSFGFLPFANNDLDYWLCAIKHYEPYLFETYFETYGIGANYYLEKDRTINYPKAQLTVRNVLLSDEDHIVKDSFARLFLQKDKSMYGIFFQAASIPELIALQVEIAYLLKVEKYLKTNILEEIEISTERVTLEDFIRDKPILTAFVIKVLFRRSRKGLHNIIIPAFTHFFKSNPVHQWKSVTEDQLMNFLYPYFEQLGDDFAVRNLNAVAAVTI